MTKVVKSGRARQTSGPRRSRGTFRTCCAEDWRMKTYDDPMLQQIAENLASDDPGIRRVAVLDLVDCGEPEAAELLILALNDPDPAVRQEAAKVVDEFDAVDIADALIAALQDSNEVVRNAAAHAQIGRAHV